MLFTELRDFYLNLHKLEPPQVPEVGNATCSTYASARHHNYVFDAATADLFDDVRVCQWWRR